MIYLRQISVQILFVIVQVWNVADTVDTTLSDETTNFTTAALLDFWEPDRSEYKRNFGGHSHRYSLNQTNHKLNKAYLRRNRGKSVRPASSAEDDNASTESRQQNLQSKLRHHSPTQRLQFRSQDNSSLKKSKTARQKPTLRRPRSTRMTPMYLMQQSSVKTVATTSIESTDPVSINLRIFRPFSLEKQLEKILQRFPEVNSTIEVIGRTTEYNNLILLKMTAEKSDSNSYFRAEESKYIDEVPEKKIVFIVHGLSVMGMPFLSTLSKEAYFQTLLSYYLQHIDKFDIFLIPMANPDGYSATRSKTIWNKNLSPQSACAGVSLDRNFDVAWNVSKVTNPCSQLYPGPSPFSEPETRAIRDVLHHDGQRIVAYIHVHAGSFTDVVFKGEAVLYPKGYTEIQSDDDKYIDLKGDIDEAMKNASFQAMSVAVDTLHNWYGTVSGSSVDYASTVYGIPYALEFVMQLYAKDQRMDEYLGQRKNSLDHNALTEIWRRIIDVVFNNIWRSLDANDVR